VPNFACLCPHCPYCWIGGVPRNPIFTIPAHWSEPNPHQTTKKEFSPVFSVNPAFLSCPFKPAYDRISCLRSVPQGCPNHPTTGYLSFPPPFFFVLTSTCLVVLLLEGTLSIRAACRICFPPMKLFVPNRRVFCLGLAPH